MRHNSMSAVRMGVCVLAALLAAPGLALAGDEPGLGKIMSNIEVHYNRLATLRLDFEQSVSYLGRRPRVERGTLSLLRPQKMRWDYTEPEGKVLVGDGQWLHLYNPLTNQVRRIDLNRAADLRAPLSFLLGRLRFSRQFRNLRLETIEERRVLVGEGRSGQDPYGRVEFTYDPDDYRLTHIKVFGHDEGITEFTFNEEMLNPRLDPALFTFRVPPGADVLDDPATPGGQ